jgi:hypothetical protein
MAKLTWTVLDKCRTADEIADLLRKTGVKGERGQSSYCPLAKATGYIIGSDFRMRNRNSLTTRPLTKAEQTFIRRFDHAQSYRDLERTDA